MVLPPGLTCTRLNIGKAAKRRHKWGKMRRLGCLRHQPTAPLPWAVVLIVEWASIKVVDWTLRKRGSPSADPLAEGLPSYWLSFRYC